MKDIKTFLIGFLTCACLFLIMGQNKSDNYNGRYQISTIFTGSYPQHTIIDTQNGEIIAKIRDHNKHYEKIIEE